MTTEIKIFIFGVIVVIAWIYTASDFDITKISKKHRVCEACKSKRLQQIGKFYICEECGHFHQDNCFTEGHTGV